MSGKRNLKAKKASAKASLEEARLNLKEWLSVSSEISDHEIVVMACDKLMIKVNGKIDIKSQIRFLSKKIDKSTKKEQPEWKSHIQSIMMEN